MRFIKLVFKLLRFNAYSCLPWFFSCSFLFLLAIWLLVVVVGCFFVLVGVMEESVNKDDFEDLDVVLFSCTSSIIYSFLAMIYCDGHLFSQTWETRALYL